MKNLRLFKNDEELSIAKDTLDRPNVSYVEDNGKVEYYPSYPGSLIIKINEAIWESGTTVNDVFGIVINGEQSTVSVTNGVMQFEKEYKYQDGVLKLENIGWDDDYAGCYFILSNDSSLIFDGISTDLVTKSVPMIPKEVKEYCKANNISIDKIGLTEENTSKIQTNCAWTVVVFDSIAEGNPIMSGLDIGTKATKKLPYTIAQSDYKYLYLYFV